jgi:polyphosphate kinase 2
MQETPANVPSAAPANASLLSNAGANGAVRFKRLIEELAHSPARETTAEAAYHRTLFHLQCELVKLQEWVHDQKLKVVVLFEGRDAAGKGGTIKRITQRLNPRLYKVVALPAPSERERSQWYFQRYVAHLPSGGEIVFFDRSWYNRAGVERVMGFCSDEEYRDFLHSVPHFERMIVRSGTTLIKYWFSISYDEQLRRLMDRAHNPLKQWKLSPMDIESLNRWEDYTKAKEIMFQYTHSPEAPWWIVDAVDKHKARLNCIHHLLTQVPYRELPQRAVALPEGLSSGQYVRRRTAEAMHVPLVY